MNFLPDSKWLEALRLPARVMTGIALGLGGVLIADWLDWLELAPFWKAITIGGVIFFGCLAVASLVGQGVEDFRTSRASKKVKEGAAAEEIAAKAKEKAIEQERKEQVLAGLDHLSKEELRYVAEGLWKKTPSVFYIRSQSSNVAIDGERPNVHAGRYAPRRPLPVQFS